MKLRIMTSAVLCALAASNASAALVGADAADVAALVGTEREIVITGASAIQNNVLNALTSVCTGGVVRMNTSSGNIRAYLCRNVAAGTTFAGQNVLVHHNVSGGSLLSVLATSAGGTDWQTIVTDYSTCAGALGGPYSGCGGLAPRRSMGGASDVDPIAFADSNIYNPANYSVSVTPGPGAQVFTVAVNTALYRAMQAAQGVSNELGPVIPANCRDDADNNLAANDWDPACQPNITREAYASIANSTGNALKASWAGLLGVGITGPGNNLVKLCRRVATSGTQASSNLFFLANPSSEVGKLAPAGANTTVAGGNGGLQKLWWWANSGTGDVLDCLGNAQTAAGPDIANPLGNAANNGQHWALGVVSAENDFRTQTAALRQHWRFIKIDGVSPEELGAYTAAREPFGRADRDQCARESYAEGRYPFGFEFVTVRATWPTANQQAFIGELLSDGLFTPLTAAGVAPSAACNLTTDNPPRGIIAKPSPAAGFNHAANPTRVSKGTSSGKPYQPIVMPSQGAEN